MLNTICLCGRLTADVEVHETKESTLGSFYLAFDQGKEDTGFIKCVAFNEVANAVAELIHKGDKIAVTGRIYDSAFQRKDGSKGHEFKIMVNSIEFIDVVYPENDEPKQEEPKEEPKPIAKANRTRR